MHSLILKTDNRAEVANMLASGHWIVACFCAAWCDTCNEYQVAFEGLAARHPDKLFVWIDIEDQADVVGELDIDNFPTLLMQHGNLVAFFGTMLPDPGIAHRLLQAQIEHGADALAAQASSSVERQGWQRDCNLRTLLNATEN